MNRRYVQINFHLTEKLAITVSFGYDKTAEFACSYYNQKQDENWLHILFECEVWRHIKVTKETVFSPENLVSMMLRTDFSRNQLYVFFLYVETRKWIIRSMLIETSQLSS